MIIVLENKFYYSSDCKNVHFLPKIILTSLSIFSDDEGKQDTQNVVFNTYQGMLYQKHSLKSSTVCSGLYKIMGEAKSLAGGISCK